MKAKHLVPNFFTLSNIGFGFFSMLAAAEGSFTRSCVLLFCAALCDLLDGKLARVLDASTEFGMQLDSLSDAISFGIAPALLVYFAVLAKLGAVGAVLAIAYVLTAVIRLARYNVDDGSTLSEVTFEGMPTPIAAGYILSFIMVRDSLPIAIVAGGTGLIAVLMVSKVKIPKFRPGGLPFAMLVFGIGTFIAFLWKPCALTWHIWNGWNFVLLISNYILLAKRGYLGEKAAAEALDYS